MAKKIYVGKISSQTTDKQLFEYFSSVGKVVSAAIVRSINPKEHAGYGYVVMSSEQETNDAITKLNNSQLNGNRLMVKEAHYLDQDRKPDYYYRRHR